MNISLHQKRQKSGAFPNDGFKSCAKKIAYLVLSRNQILDDVWGYDCDVIDRTIDAYIRNIRKKLRLDCITTIKGIGYKFEMENHYENKAIL